EAKARALLLAVGQQGGVAAGQSVQKQRLAQRLRPGPMGLSILRRCRLPSRQDLDEQMLAPEHEGGGLGGNARGRDMELAQHDGREGRGPPARRVDEDLYRLPFELAKPAAAHGAVASGAGMG